MQLCLLRQTRALNHNEQQCPSSSTGARQQLMHVNNTLISTIEGQKRYWSIFTYFWRLNRSVTFYVIKLPVQSSTELDLYCKFPSRMLVVCVIVNTRQLSAPEKFRSGLISFLSHIKSKGKKYHRRCRIIVWNANIYYILFSWFWYSCYCIQIGHTVICLRCCLHFQMAHAIMHVFSILLEKDISDGRVFDSCTLVFEYSWP